MKRPGYREALEWMALNDDVYWLAGDPDTGAGAISVTGALVRDLWDVDEAKFRKDLINTIKRVAPSHEVVHCR
jgi:hypothetical protein